jgi:glycosyltransferase involved in cell wall biosynthesis
MTKPKISIITVVFNSENLIEKTINSILSQTYRNIEYIIIDGNSKDNTLQIINKYSDNIACIISEPDKGLYDAMNKGLLKATGDYVCFLNSGDQLYSNNTIENVFGNLSEFPDIVYGETMIVDISGNELGLRRLKAPENLSWKSFKNGMLVCHQSIYIKRTIADYYNLNYRISADYEWVLKSLKKTKSIHNSNEILTRFLDGGINKKNIRKGLTERLKIMIKYYGMFPTVFNHVIIGVKFFWFWFKNKRF